MDLALDILPDDFGVLRAMLLAERNATGETIAKITAETVAHDLERARLATEIADLQATMERMAAQAARYEHMLAQLRRLNFGKRSEQIDADQLQLGLEDIQQGFAALEAEEDKDAGALKAHRAGKRREARASLPEHLPRVDVVIEPEATVCPGCDGRRRAWEGEDD